MFEKVEQLQNEAVTKFFTESNHRLIVGFPVGIGKTVVGLRVSERFIDTVNKKAKILAVVPANLRPNFYDSIHKFKLENKLVPIIISSPSEINEYYNDFNFFIISYNFSAKYYTEILKKKFDLVIFDESHYGKNPGTGFSRSMEELCMNIDSVLLLTASFISNRIEEFGRLLYYVTKNKTFLRVQSVKDLLPYKNLIKQHVIIIPESSVNQLVRRPTPIYHRVKIPLDDYTTKVYNYVENGDNARAFIEKIKLGKWNTREVKNVIIMLQQVLLVPEYVDPLYTPQSAKYFGSKVTYCLQHLRSVKGKYKVIVYVPFVQAGALAISRYFKQNGINCEVYYSGLSTDERKELVDRYENGDLDVLILTNAGKEGINLPSTKQIIFLGYSWNPEDLTQIVGRALRVTSKHKTVDVFLYENIVKRMFVLEKKTIDGYMLDVIQRKKSLKVDIENVFGEKVRRFESYA